MGQLRRHRDELARLARRPVGDHDGAGEHVAEPLAPLRDQRRDQRGRSGQQPELQHPGQPAEQRLTEAHGTAVVADHPQPERQLAEAAPPGQGLEDHRIADQDQHRQQDHDGGVHGEVGDPRERT